MESRVYAYYKDLPQWAKGAVVVGSLAAVGFVGYKLYRQLFPSQDERQSQQFVNAVSGDIEKYRFQGLRQSYPDAQYAAFANSIYESMKYAAGDNYGSVVDTCKKMQNNLDVALLVDAFGLRQDYFFAIPTGKPMDIFTFIKSELGNEWGGLTDYRVKQINTNWESKGITYKI